MGKYQLTLVVNYGIITSIKPAENPHYKAHHDKQILLCLQLCAAAFVKILRSGRLIHFWRKDYPTVNAQ